MEKPQECHLTTVNRVFRYIKGIIDHGVLMSGKKKTNIDAKVYGYTNPNFSGDQDEKKTACYIFMIGGAPISWSSRKNFFWLYHLLKLSTWMHHVNQHV